MNTRYVLALHGGAGTIDPCPPDAQRPWHEALRAALAIGEAVLAGGGGALDAVVATVVALEECPLFNAGRGAVFTADERHELDAGVMDGTTLAAGAAAGLRRVRNPVLAAREVMRDGRSVLMCADGAEAFAAAHGLEMVDPDWFSTPERRAQLHAVRTLSGGMQALDHRAGGATPTGAGRFGTVGAVALDRQGHLAAATSTGGMTNKSPGRIGDSPIIGAGVYANDTSCALSATGTGEHFIRACAAYDVHARMRYLGQPLDAAVHTVLEEGLAPLGGVGGMIAIGRDGALSMRFNATGMYRAWVREGEPGASAIFDD